MSDDEVQLSKDTEAILLEFLAEKAIRDKQENKNSDEFLFEENWVREFFLQIIIFSVIVQRHSFSLSTISVIIDFKSKWNLKKFKSDDEDLQISSY